jgi:BA14K-like protein
MLKHSLIAMAALGAGLVVFSANEASAFMAAPKPAIELNDNPLLTDVHRRSYHHHRRYRYNNYYGNPWWGFGGGLGFGLGYYNDGYYDGYYRRDYGSHHVAWCLNRYRSYKPRANTWVSYSGRVHQCHSPYRY